MDSDTHAPDWQSTDGDRRADKRTATRVDARLQHPGGVLDGVVVDISFGGAKFVTNSMEPALQVGTCIVLTLEAHVVKQSEDLRWNGAVVRSERSGDDGPERIAYAIAFDDSAPRPLPGLDDAD
jgi:hypothetical protein